MKHSKIEGYAIVRKAWTGNSYEVLGVGQDTPQAWADAGERHDSGRTPTRDLYKEFPSWTCVPAVIQVSFTIPK